MAKKRKKIEREADLVVVAALYKRSWNMRDIANEISRRRPYSISHVQIKHDVDEVLKRWQEQSVDYIDKFIAIKLEEIRALKVEAWNEYMRSKLPIKMRKEKRKALVAAGVLDKPKKQIQKATDSELDKLFSCDVSPTKELQTDLTKATGTVEVDQSYSVTEKIGNPKFLDLVTRLIEQEAKLLGFYKTDNLTPTTAIVIVQTPQQVSKEDFIPTLEIPSEDE